MVQMQIQTVHGIDVDNELTMNDPSLLPWVHNDNDSDNDDAAVLDH
jgi:hypothetical protein